MTHLPSLIQDLALILGAGAATSVLFKLLKQPVVLGYILVGFVVGNHISFFPSVVDTESVRVWAEIGVIFLLFGLGLEFSFHKLVRVGGASSITGLIEVAAMLTLGFWAGQLLGWSFMDSLFLGGMLSISSTTIIIRAFEELGLKKRAFASMVFGVLIVEDLVAILLLVLLSTVAATRQFQGMELLLSFFRLSFFLILWFVLGIFAIPSVLRRLKTFISDELLVVFSLGMCFLMVILASSVGFSPALGAFIMGSILAETPYAKRIEHAIQPIRSLFGVVFFVSVGMLINPSTLIEHAGAVIFITVLTIVGKILSTSLGALLAGQSLKTSIQSGFSLAQIGEFSFIIATLGLTLKVTSPFLYPVAVAVSALTTFTTPYLIRASEPFYDWVERNLPARAKTAITSYGSITQRIGTQRTWKTFVFNQALAVIVNATIVVGITGLVSRVVLPWVEEQITHAIYAPMTAFVLTLLLTAPFLWAIALGGTQLPQDPRAVAAGIDRSTYRVPFFILRSTRLGVALILLLGISVQYLPFWLGALVTGVVMFAYTALISKELQTFYVKVRDQFLGNLSEESSEGGTPVRRPPRLAPWDAHIIELTVPPESHLIGKSLFDIKIREHYGITVALITRGRKKITAPGRHDCLYPQDSLYVIGTDDQIQKFKADLEKGAEHTPTEESPYRLHSLILDDKSSLVGKTIRNSGVRDSVSGLVVGVEREGKRFLNPDSSLELQTGDLLWIVGDSARLKSLESENQIVPEESFNTD